MYFHTCERLSLRSNFCFILNCGRVIVAPDFINVPGCMILGSKFFSCPLVRNPLISNLSQQVNGECLALKKCPTQEAEIISASKNEQMSLDTQERLCEC